MKSLLKLLSIGLLFQSSVFANQQSADVAAVKEVVSRYETALNDSDVDEIVALYSQSPTFMPQHAPAQIGRLAVKQAYENVFAAIDLKIAFTTHELEVLGNTAWARTSSAGKTTILANGQVVNEGNNELFIFKKEKGEWKIYQYLFTTNQPRS